MTNRQNLWVVCVCPSKRGFPLPFYRPRKRVTPDRWRLDLAWCRPHPTFMEACPRWCSCMHCLYRISHIRTRCVCCEILGHCHMVGGRAGPPCRCRRLGTSQCMSQMTGVRGMWRTMRMTWNMMVRGTYRPCRNSAHGRLWRHAALPQSHAGTTPQITGA